MQGLINGIGVLGRTSRLYTGGDLRQAELLRDFVRDADGDVLGAAFLLEQGGVRSAMQSRLDAGHQVRLLRDREYLSESSAGPGIDVRYGARDSDKNHAKYFVDTRGDGLVQTWAVQPKTAGESRLDFSVSVHDDDARALERFARAELTGDPEGIRAATELAAARGILANDPLASVLHLRQGTFDLIDSARERLYVGTKYLRSDKVVERLAAAQERGVDVILEIHSGKGLGRAAKAGVDARHIGDDKANYLHGNIIVADGERVLVSSAPLYNRGLGGANAGRASLELGARLDDATAAKHALRALARLDGSHAADHI